MKRDVSRRSFMKTAAVASAAPLVLPRLSFATPVNSKLQHAGIGVNAQGAHDLGNISSHDQVEVVALCDIDEVNLNRAAKLHPNARLYRDWRVMLDQEEGKIDSVNVSTPDHTHAPASLSAIRQGIHVFCEKPLTHEVYEARKVTEAARKAGVVTQMGNQIHSHKFYRTAVQWVREGSIGKVKEWHSWVGAIFTTPDKKFPAGSDPVPSYVDWDLWCGTAPVIPFKEKEYHPFLWRRFRDYGGGAVGDFGCHIFDPVFSALGVAHPLSITAHAESYSEEVHPGWTIANYLFPGTEMTAYDTICASWRDGGLKPDTKLSPHFADDYALPPSGSMLIGEEGTIVIPHVGMPQLHPLKNYENYPVPELEDRSHYHEFVNVCLGKGGTTGSNFDFAGPMAEAVLLANIANRLPGHALEWAGKRCKFKNRREA
ncbi:MAG: Gfo/Idh/MocA family oxidoreductase, partial [Candidatus Hydrogenedentes bacterium]|nr:Gfo/Idh/MocA family oxidoreductase [Candidatus Hydrogenedentota bacterium]